MIGRDVVWQALRGTRATARIVFEIFQRAHASVGQSRRKPPGFVLAEFLEHESLDEVQINQSRSQRNDGCGSSWSHCTALWLMRFNIRVQCFKVFLPLWKWCIHRHPPGYSHTGSRILHDRYGAEGSRRTINQRWRRKQSQRLRKAFWTQMLEKFHASDCTLYNNISPSMDHWLCAGSGISGMPYNLIFSKKEIRVELWISRHLRTSTPHGIELANNTAHLSKRYSAATGVAIATW